MTSDEPRTDHTVGQATEMLKAGYHIDHVVRVTGWGRSYFEDCVDAQGYWDCQ